MRTSHSLLCVVIGLVGCAAGRAPATYGNFISTPAKLDEKLMADDVVRRMAMLYPPARSSIQMRQATPDVFGATLTAALRQKGYALTEFGSGLKTTSLEISKPFQARAPGNLALSYLVDQSMEAGMYRVTVLINDQSLSRLYQAKDGSLVPAGYWVRKE